MSEPIVGTRRGEPSVGFHRISLPERRQGSKRSEGSNKFLGGSLGYREYGRRDKYHANSSEKLDAISPQRSRSWLQLRLASGEKLLSWLHQYRVRDLLQIGLSPDKNIHLRNQNLCLWRPGQSGGYAVFISDITFIRGYQREAWGANHNTWARICSERWAPRSLQRICCFFTNRLLTTWLTADSANPVEMVFPCRYRSP
jgi:hypothetical protein